MNAAEMVQKAIKDVVEAQRRPCGMAEKAAVLNQVRDAHPEIIPILEIDFMVGKAIAHRIKEVGRALSLEEVQGIKAEVEKRWNQANERTTEERQKLKRYTAAMAIEKMKLARKADRDGRLEEAVGWYGGSVWFLNRYWPYRARVVGDRMDVLRKKLRPE